MVNVRRFTLGCILFCGTLLMITQPASLARAGKPLLSMGDGGTFQQLGSETVWQVERTRKIKDVLSVEQYLAELNKGEFSDWRLPNKQELSKLFTAFDMKQNGQVKIRLEGYYWLADENGKPYAAAWEIGDGCGPSRTFYKGNSGYVRAVRP